MQASIYRLILGDHDDGEPHPHVIVLTFTGNRDCIAVPAYSIDGYMIQEQIRRDRERGLSDDQIFVHLDNARDVDFTFNYPGKDAYWCVTRFRRLSQRWILTEDCNKYIGTMKIPAFRKISQALLNYAETDKSDLSPNALKALRNLVKNLPAEIPAEMPPSRSADPNI